MGIPSREQNTENFLSFIKENHIQFVDLRFTDLQGIWHHMTVSSDLLSPSTCQEGIGFDGSSIPGWCSIESSDLLIKPDLDPDLKNVFKDPFMAHPTLVVLCDVMDPQNGLPYQKDPRSIAKRAQNFLLERKIADTAYFGPEAEFFVFDQVNYGQKENAAFYELESSELPYNPSKGSGYYPQTKGGYFPVPPTDSAQDLRSEMCRFLDEVGICVEKHHHEVASAQHEIGFKYGTLLTTADQLQIYKYIVRQVAHRYGKTATFMPKPLYGDNGSGMHVHQSLWLEDTNLFSGEEYAGLSETALYYIGGILAHAKSLNAFTNPTTNSYKRLVPGFEAPVICAYSARNRSAACRIPWSGSPHARRIEMRFPDPTANSYLALSAMMMAGLDGIEKKIHPGDPQTADLFEEENDLPTVAASLEEALASLEEDYEYLLKGDVFSKECLESYLNLKWQEVEELNHSPHPLEFIKYYQR